MAYIKKRAGGKQFRNGGTRRKKGEEQSSEAGEGCAGPSVIIL